MMEGDEDTEEMVEALRHAKKMGCTKADFKQKARIKLEDMMDPTISAGFKRIILDTSDKKIEQYWDDL